MKLRGIGLKTYEDDTKRFGTAPFGFALYAVEAGRVAIDGHIGKWSFDRNGDVDYDVDELDRTISGFKVVKADGPIGCKFQFETMVE